MPYKIPVNPLKRLLFKKLQVASDVFHLQTNISCQKREQKTGMHWQIVTLGSQHLEDGKKFPGDRNL